MVSPAHKRPKQVPPTKAKAWHEQEILKAIRKRYPAPEWVIFPQVRNATGYSGQVRTADAIAMNLWPSRGMEIIGFEFKSYRSDWLKEIANPAKSAEIQRFCDRWWVVAGATNVFNEADPTPITWGLLEIDHATGKMSVKKDAPKLEAEPPTRRFLASVLKASADYVTPEAWVKHAADEAYMKGIEEGHKQHEHEIKNLRESLASNQKAIDEFQRASGVRISQWDAGQIGSAVRIVSQGPEQVLSYLRREKEHLGRMVKTIDDALTDLGANNASLDI